MVHTLFDGPHHLDDPGGGRICFTIRGGVSRMRGDLELRFLQERLDLAAADVGTEELRHEVRDLVGLVKNHGIGGPQNVPEAVLLEGEIREQQVMIDNDDVSIERLAPGKRHVTARKLRATRTEAVVTSGSDVRPDRVGVRQAGHFGKIPPARRARPALDARQHSLRHGVLGPGVVQGQLFTNAAHPRQPIAAQVIAAPLQQSDACRPVPPPPTAWAN